MTMRECDCVVAAKGSTGHGNEGKRNRGVEIGGH
jgi:hypothetical protein